jgi:NADH-quinone oxidoreductase subunit L
MTVALGASAYSAGIFHLATHAFFKALLFLGAGSVIIAMHHEQDMRRMGGLRKYMPITYLTMMVGALASAGIPGLSGFFSKDSIIEAAHLSHTPGAAFAYFCVLSCVFVTALYTFRMMFMTFHGNERYAAAAGHDHHDDHGEHGGHAHAPHESPAVVTLPLIALAIPSVAAGWLIGPVLFGGYFDKSIFVLPQHDVVAELAHEFHGVAAMTLHALGTLPFWLAIGGMATAFYLYLVRPDLPARIKEKAGVLYTVLDRKYYIDELYSWLFAGGARALGTGLWQRGDVSLIDGVFVNGTARLIGWFAFLARRLQSGYIYHYAFAMIIGILLLLTMVFAG